MSSITVVKIINLDKYKNSFAKKYGILQQSMEETAVVNFTGNMGGMCVNIAHEDYKIIPKEDWMTIGGEVAVFVCGYPTKTGLRIWR